MPPKVPDKHKRALELAAVAGLVVLVVMLARRRNAENTAAVPAGDGVIATSPAVGTATAPGDYPPGLADNTSYLAGLSDQVSSGLGDVGTSLQTQASTQQALAQAIATQSGALTGLTDEIRSGALVPRTPSVPAPQTPQAPTVKKPVHPAHPVQHRKRKPAPKHAPTKRKR